MLKEDKVIFLKNSNEVLEHLIKNFVKTSELNRRTQLDYGMYFDDPLVGFASGNDPLFFEYKSLIGSFHYTPGEIIEAALREKSKGLFLAETDRVSVISWILPAQEDVRKSNRGETQLPSQLWLYLKEFGEACNDALRQHVVHYLEDLGYTAVAPARLPSVVSFRDDRVGWASAWSERHVAYACGLGTFGLSDGLITPKGKAVRIGSVVTNLKLAPSERRYRQAKENCLFFRNEKCGKCMQRCPVGAITEKGHDKDKCKEYLDSEPMLAKRSEYGPQQLSSACGLCQTRVPCEFQIPRPDLIA